MSDLFQIGDTVFLVEADAREKITETCPDCLGQLAWHVTMPSGEEFPLDCPTCNIGYNQPRGVVTRYGDPVARIVAAEVTGMDKRGDGIEYHTTCGYRKAGQVSSSQADAAGLVKAEIDRINKYHEAERKKRREAHCREVNRPFGRISREDLRDACRKFDAADLYHELTGGRLPKKAKP